MSDKNAVTETKADAPVGKVIAPTGFITPATWDEAMNLARWVKQTRFCPKDYTDKEDAELVIAFHMGARLGLDPVQSLQGIAVINGRPCLWGDHLRSIVMASGLVAGYDRYNDGKKAVWKYWRNGIENPFIGEFSLEDANRAGLLQRSPVWKSYPSRMLDMRASAFAIRNGFPDVIMGFHSREEMEDSILTTAEPITNPEPMKQTKEKPAEPKTETIRPVEEPKVASGHTGKVKSVQQSKHDGPKTYTIEWESGAKLETQDIDLATAANAAKKAGTDFTA